MAAHSNRNKRKGSRGPGEERTGEMRRVSGLTDGILDGLPAAMPALTPRLRRAVLRLTWDGNESKLSSPPENPVLSSCGPPSRSYATSLRRKRTSPFCHRESPIRDVIESKHAEEAL